MGKKSREKRLRREYKENKIDIPDKITERKNKKVEIEKKI